ncbi:acid-resistance membrane protein [Methanobrevibacter cuticularis]|uniref:Acid-resistance membrane protein n=1 Tax=Methanobrevibacter cuticularis TaxID=47311 RepID=A0A166F6U7_9EURY|nr:DUF308 domain-containing protein [Methanobrevibacter cuticularis]KZX17375.1 acid-resistance membrane protein [Methanobrevibacter cuticularis]
MINKRILGILGIILGVILLSIPFFDIFILDNVIAIAIIILGIYLIFKGIQHWEENKATTVFFLLIALFAIVFGIMLIENIVLFSILVIWALYIAGFLLILGGIAGLTTRSKNSFSKESSALALIFGIVLLMSAQISLKIPGFGDYLVALIIGIWLVVEGFIFVLGTNKEVFNQ